MLTAARPVRCWFASPPTKEIAMSSAPTANASARYDCDLMQSFRLVSPFAGNTELAIAYNAAGVAELFSVGRWQDGVSPAAGQLERDGLVRLPATRPQPPSRCDGDRACSGRGAFRPARRAGCSVFWELFLGLPDPGIRCVLVPLAVELDVAGRWPYRQDRAVLPATLAWHLRATVGWQLLPGCRGIGRHLGKCQ